MTKIFIATPTTGTVTAQTTASLMNLSAALSASAIPFQYQFTHRSNLVLSRNLIADRFWRDDDSTHLLFVDADMSFSADAVLRLLEFGKPLTAAAYPRRSVDLKKLVEAGVGIGRAGTNASMRAVLGRIYDFALDDEPPQGMDHWVPKISDGFISLPGAGTGLMLIHRSVLEDMRQAGAAPEMVLDTTQPDSPSYRDYFSYLKTSDGLSWMSEDLSFCRRWREQCGGDVWVDTKSMVGHVGQMVNQADYGARVSRIFPQATDEVR